MTPRGKILHRVHCYNHEHEHGSFPFEDDPVYKGKNRMLTGQKPVPNLSFLAGTPTSASSLRRSTTASLLGLGERGYYGAQICETFCLSGKKRCRSCPQSYSKCY